jgi:glucose/arabinose dehydrogenase
MSKNNCRFVISSRTVALVLTLTLLWFGSSVAVPPNFVNEIAVPGLLQPISIEFSLDNRMFVVGHLGTIWVALPGSTQLLSTPFIQLPNIDTSYAENGAYGMAFDPNFSTNSYFYVFYTASTPNGPRDRVSRFTATANTGDPASEFVVWEDLDVPGSTHHGGAIDFGPDGNLYIAVGENYDASQAQMVNTFRGKILRMRADGAALPDNPFYVGLGEPQDYVWAMGLRNPFRIKFDDPTGELYIGDVGGNVQSTAVEEVNLGRRGANYGWPLCEGPCSVSGMTSPIFSYPHNGLHASISGGFVYRGSQFPSSYKGTYFYGDYVQSWISNLTFDSSGNVTGSVTFEPSSSQVGAVVDLDEGPDGALYYVAYDPGSNGAIHRIRYVTGNQPPVASSSASPVSGPAPLTVNFSSFGSFDPDGLPLTYIWDLGDGSMSTQPDPSYTYQTRGQYTVRLTVSDGTTSVLAAPLTIRVGNSPQPTIDLPTASSFFIAGETIPFSGTATDVEDGSLPASAFSWNVGFYHDGHIHPAFGPFDGVTSGSFQIPTSGHDFSGNTSYIIALTVTDSDGITQSTSVSIFPTKVNLTLDTSPAGAALDLDGIRQKTPFVLDTLVGFMHTVSAPDQVLALGQLTFSSWSDGGAQTHTVTVPVSDVSLTANYNVTPVPALLGSTLDNASSVLMPASGTGSNASINTTPADDFVPALDGNGLRIDASGEYAQFVQTDGVTQNIELDKGAIDFWFQPTYNHTDGLRHYLFATGTFGATPGGIFVLKNNALNQNQLNVNITDASGAFHVTGVDPIYYSWTPGEWVHVRVSWDTTISGQNVHIYLKGTEVPAYAYVSTGPISMAAESTTQFIYLGQQKPGGTVPANGIFDDFILVGPGTAPPSPGDTTPPVLSGGQPTGTLPAGTSNTSLAVQTDEACTCKYAASPDIPYASMPVTFAVTGGTSHSSPISGLVDGGVYTYYVRCQDAAGNANLSDYTISFAVASSTPPSPGVLLSSSLDDLNAVTMPAVGTGVGSAVNTSPANDFVPGIAGNGLRIDAATEYARFVETDGVTQNVELDHGTVDFWYQPSYASNDGVRHTLLTIGQVSGPTVGIYLEKNNGVNSNEFTVRVSNATGRTYGTGVSSNFYGWSAGQWVRVRVTWDFNSTGRAVHIYFDGAEVGQYSYDRIPSLLTMGPESQTAFIYLGERTASGKTPADGVIDELTIYDQVVIP